MAKKTLVSGVKPTGELHIGNYFGAIRQLVEFQDKYNSFVFIADLHALTSVQNRDELEKNSLDIAIDYLALGIDPSKTTLFVQSAVPQHAELTWVFNCLTTMPYLMRAHAFKDAEQKNKEINIGVFDYPMLMSADILLYDANVVPVGLDQKQHLEITRDTAEKFNRVFGETFTIPEPVIIESVGTVYGTDGKKMSKSYGNVIRMFATRDEIQKAVMGIVTDSNTDVPENVYRIHTLFKTESELKPVYDANKGKYKNLKEVLIEDIDAFIAPFRAKRAEIENDKGGILKILKEGNERARDVAHAKMKIVKNKIGFLE